MVQDMVQERNLAELLLLPRLLLHLLLLENMRHVAAVELKAVEHVMSCCA